MRSRRTRAMRNSTMRLSENRYLHHCSFRSEKNQRTWDKLITLLKKVCCQLSPFSHAQVRGDPYTNQVQTCLRNGNQVATWKTKESGFSLKYKKRANSRSSQNWDPEARISSRVSQKKYPGTIWNYWFSAKGNWSCNYKWWTIQARSTTTSRTKIRTKSGSSWSSCQKSSWDGRIEESSRITNRWIFEQKIDRKSGHYQWTHGKNSGITEWSQLYERLERF